MRATVIGLALLAWVAGCGGADDQRGGAMACVPGAQVECACPGGAKGAQACDDDGGGYGACQCGSAATGGAGASGTGSASATTTSSSATTGAGGGPVGDACPAGCPMYQVCSDGTDGHSRGECWGCTKIADSGFCNPATYDLYVNCGTAVPVGCYLQDGDRYCCKR